ncbi:hypothetical protein NKH18_31235 [Streptomyces sp. M10(2022)]
MERTGQDRGQDRTACGPGGTPAEQVRSDDGGALDLIEADPALGEPLAAADDYLRAEIVYAASHEGPGTSTTYSPGAPGSPSRPSTGAPAAPGLRGADGAGAGLGQGADRAGGQALREAGTGRAGIAASAGRPDGGRGTAGAPDIVPI